MQKKDPWHYPRVQLAKQILSVFESGLSSSFIFFAPRRMGKTEFLRKDMQPIAQTRGWSVFYFSFLDAADNPAMKFQYALEQFIRQQSPLGKIKNAVKTKLSAGIGIVKAGLEFSNQPKEIKELLGKLAKQRKTLLLMDEVQVLALKQNDNFIAGFRTALDLYKDNLKVIFTGSSQRGLRQMFSEAKAPFFHFGQSFNFPEFDKGFTDHLSKIFKATTCRNLDAQKLWNVFIELGKIPLLIRNLVERVALNPNLTIDRAKEEIVSEVFGSKEFEERWQSLSALEQILLKKIAHEKTAHIFSKHALLEIARQLNKSELSVPQLQAAIKKLIRKNLIGKAESRSSYFIDDSYFKNWLIRQNNI